MASYSCGDETELISCSAPVANGAPIDTTTPGPHGFTVTAVDRFDNVTTQTVVYHTPDSVGPTVTTSVIDGQVINVDEYFLFQLRCLDAGGVATCSAVDENGQIVAPQSALNASAGPHTLTITAVDASGNNSNRVIHYTAAPDTFGPTVTIASPQHGAVYAYGDAATVSFSCADQSGLYQCGPAQVQTQFVYDGGALPTLAAGVHTLTVRARDPLNNETVATVTYTVLAGPDAIITSPVQGAQYRTGDAVTAGFTCSSPLGVSQCVGTVPSGAAIDTSAAGNFTFTVNVADNGGFSRSIEVSYVVLAADVPPVVLPTPSPGGFLGPIDIGTLGGSYADPSLISANGIIVGRSSVAGDATQHAFVWTQANGMKDLGDVNANAVSTTATVVGSVNVPQPIQTQMQVGYRRAFAWTPSGGTKMLATPEFEIDETPRRADDIYGGSEANYVNASGMAAGSLLSWRVSFYMGPFAFYDTRTRPVLWRPNGDVVTIPQIGSSMYLMGLNDSGQVLLRVEENGMERAKLWSEAGGFVDIGDLGGGQTSASQMHASGVVIGTSATTDGPHHAFVWTAAGGMVDIGDFTFVSGVNASGQVLGYSQSLGTYLSWSQSTGVVPLQDLGSGFAAAGVVNASGQIFGETYTAGFAEKHAAMWAADGSITDLGLVDGLRGLSDNHIATGVVGNSAMVWLLPGFTPDATAPAVTVTSPANAATLAQNSSVTAAFSCTDAQGIASCLGTVANGSAIDTSATGTFAFTASAADSNGNYTVTTTHYTVSAGGGGATPGHMRGEGRIRSANDPNERQRFAFNVLARPTGQQQLRFNFWTADPDDTPRRTNVFDATSITAMHFSDDAGFVSGSRANAPTMDTVTFSGTGAFNNQSRYTFEVTATDQGEPGAGRDTFSLTVKDGNGATVFSASGALDSGNIQSLRLPNRHFPPFLTGGPQRVREVEATDTTGAVVTFDLPTAVSETGAALTVTCEPASGTTFPMGRTRGTCTATDSNGRTGRMVFAVIVSDNTAPAFAAPPANITVDATSRQGAEVTFALPIATDLVDTDVVVTCNPGSGRRFKVGTTTVTCKARDNAHNVAETTFTVTVNDTIAPTIKVAKPVQGGQFRQGSSQVASYSCSDTVGVTECTGTVPDGAAIDTSTVGTFVFTVTARDAAGNQTVKAVSYSVKPR